MNKQDLYIFRVLERRWERVVENAEPEVIAVWEIEYRNDGYQTLIEDHTD